MTNQKRISTASAVRWGLMGAAIVEAVKAYATAGEVFGVIRLARGLSYDPFDMVQCPFELH